ncbi:MAG: glycosyltransferase family 4 protein [Pantoea sp.]|uniref:glycosyltransferase family 4 protein n=1 Tax=Pantoea sp. TaxID=69393 RepID=UPI0039E4BED3
MDKKKVIYIDTCHDVAGGQRSLIALLSKIKNEVNYDILIDKNNLKYKNELIKSGIELNRIKTLNSIPLKSRALGGLNVFFRTLVLGRRYSIAHCNTFYDGLFAMPSFRLWGGKTVFRARCGIDLSNHGLIDSLIYNFSTVVLANSEYVKNTFKRVSNSLSKIQVIYNPLDLKFLDKPTVVESNGKTIIAVIGAITEVKNQMEVLKAFSLLEDDDLILRFIGEPRSTSKDKEYYESLERFVLEKGISEKIQFTGFISDVRTHLNDVSLVCVPSDREPLGRVIFESQLYQIPVLASDSGGNSELIEDGRTGYLYNLGDVEQLSTKLMLAKKDNRLISENAKSFIIKRFSPEKTYLAELAIYNKISGE